MVCGWILAAVALKTPRSGWRADNRPAPTSEASTSVVPLRLVKILDRYVIRELLLPMLLSLRC